MMALQELNFLMRFDRFYQVITKAVEKDKISESDFYALIIAKCKNMERERRERIEIKVELPTEYYFC